MSVTIQGLRFTKDRVIVSVGFFLTKDFTELNKVRPKYVEAYEPRPKIYQQYVAERCSALLPFPDAVGGKNGTAFLQERSTKSTIMDTTDQASPNTYPVKVVSMTSIIERVVDVFGGIDDLLINCEGAEIDIIKETDPKLFAQCKRIFVQFHDFIPFLEITQMDIDDCLRRLNPYFAFKCLHRRYSKYEFTRRKT